MPVKDLERAIVFCRDTLGLRFLFQAPPALAFFDCGGVRLMLDIPEDGEFRHHSSVLYLKVADIETAHADLKARGVVFLGGPQTIGKMPPITLWMAFFTDAEGNTHALMSAVRDPS